MPPVTELPSGTVTFLFTDVEGSTRLLERLGRERYGTLLARHHELLRAAFARHGGIEVDCKGDAFFAVFTSAGAAVAAAADAQRALHREDWPAGAVVRVRIGLNTGEAAASSGGYVGVAIHLAAHVGAVAVGGQTLLTSTVARIVEHELPEGVHLRDVGERLLKGRDRPERLFALDGGDLPSTRSAEVAPASGDRRAPAPLLERGAHVAALRALVDAAREGSGRLATVEGSAGIGKTRLLAEVRGMAQAAGFRVLSARGGELEREFAFGVVRQLFEPLLATTTPAQHAELFAGAAGLCAPLFGESGVGDGPAVADVPFATLHGLYWLAANVAVDQPTVLLVDDAHWSDAPSLRWLAHLARRLDGLPLLLCVGTRPPEQSEHPALVTELLTDPAAMVVRPGALGLGSVEILARDVFGSEPAAEFCAACLKASGGNPLYVRALLLTLAGDGLAPDGKAAARLLEVGPEPVARAVSLRLARLPADAAALARAIAVLGQGAELGLAATLAGVDPADASASAAALVRAELLRVEPALDFVHPVVRAAVYETIGALERADAHRRAAGLLADAGADAEHVAAHLLRIPPAGDPFTVSTLRRASTEVLARGASAEAAVYLRRALAEAPAAAIRAELLAELGSVERNVDLPAALEHLGEAMRIVSDDARFVAVALEYGRALGYTGTRNDEAIAALRAGIARADDAHADLREQATADLINASWTEARYLPAAKELIASIREDQLAGGYGSDLIRALLAHHELRRGADRARASALAARALASGALESQSSQELFCALDTLRGTGDLDAGRAAYTSALGAATQRGDLLNAGGLMTFRGWVEIDQGDLHAAEPDVREGLAHSEEHGEAGQVLYSAIFLALYLLERGDVDEAARVIDGLALPEQLPDNFHFVQFWRVRGRLRLERRRPELALTDFLAIRRVTEQLEMPNPDWPWRSDAAAALHALGCGAEARELATEELALARRWGARRQIGIALRALARLEPGPEGVEILREACEVLAPSPARLEHARALVDLGALLRRSNERSEARELLREGVELAHACGAVALVERANEELAATGARPRRVLQTGLDSLTASERRVAQLAAEDLSNKAIAQTLFVTVKTVELHLSNVYRKLDIASRRQLALALVEPHAGSLAGS